MAEDINTTLSDLIVAINAMVEAQKRCCLPSGQVSDGESSNTTDVDIGIDGQFPDNEAYFDAKCNVSNNIYDAMLTITEWFKTNNIDVLAGAYGGITTGVILALTLAGPPGWAVAAISTAVAGLAALLISVALDFEDVLSALENEHEEGVLALYNSSSAAGARQAFLDAVGGGAVALSPAEEQFLYYVLPNKSLNALFTPTEAMASYSSPDPVDCGTALLLHWPFDADLDGFTFADESTGGNSATGVWDANDGDGAVKITLVNVGDSQTAIGSIEETGLSQAVGIGNSIQFDFSATSDGVNMTKLLEVVYSDLTEDSVYVGNSKSAGTIILSVMASKTLSEVKLTISRNWSQSGNGIIFITDGRVQ